MNARGIAVEVRDVVREFAPRGRETVRAVVRAVDGVSLRVAAGACVALSGPSGCGKSTLLALMGALDRATSGAVLHDDVDLADASETERARVRRRVGFVFQAAPMIRGLAVWENVTQALVPRGVRSAERRKLAAAALERLGIAYAIDRAPEEISGGERQRVALARALAVEPGLVLADEPTSQLDPASAASVLDALREVAASGCTLVMASHDPQVLALAQSVRTMRAGREVAGDGS